MTTGPDVYGVIGHPVAHSWSPFIHGLFARQTGEHMVYRLHDVAPAEFRSWVVRFFDTGGRGLNVTIPHKAAAADFASELTPRATRAGAVNTLALGDDRHLLGDNTDGAGLVQDLEVNLGLPLAGRSVLLLGAGGAARGVLGPIVDRKPASIVVANRSAARARSLAHAVSDVGGVLGCGFGEISPVPVDLVINATAASLHGEVPAVSPAILGRGTVCYDMAYSHTDTPFVQWANVNGCGRAVQGWGMLVEQAAESFLLWRGLRPDTRPVLEALRAHPAGMPAGR
jgi:shikimate dehydrogenase